MKKIILTIAFLLMTSQAYAQSFNINVDLLNIREHPNTTSRILGKGLRDSLITVLSIENNWARIMYNGNYAYVSVDFLRRAEPKKVEVIKVVEPKKVEVIKVVEPKKYESHNSKNKRR